MKKLSKAVMKRAWQIHTARRNVLMTHGPSMFGTFGCKGPDSSEIAEARRRLARRRKP